MMSSASGGNQPVLMELSAPPIYMNSPHHDVGMCSGGLGDNSACLDDHRAEEVGNFINLLPPPPLAGNLLSHEPQLFNQDGHSEGYITNIIDPINFQAQSRDPQHQAHITHRTSTSNFGSRPSVHFDRQYEDNCGRPEITDLDLRTSGSVVIKSCQSPTAAAVIVNGAAHTGPQINNSAAEYFVDGNGEQQQSYSTIHTISANETTVTTCPKPAIIGIADTKTDGYLSHTPPTSADESAIIVKAGSAVDTVVSNSTKVSKTSRSRVKPGRPPRAARGMVHHKCRSCEKTFISHKGLTQHEVIHTDKKPFECKICGKAFKFKSNLFEHKSIHADGNRYKCQLCGKTCRLKGNLKKHLRTHEKNGELKNFDLACREIINCNQNGSESKESTIDEEGEEDEDHEVGEGDSEANVDSKSREFLLKSDPVCKSTPETAYRVIVCHSTQNTKRSDGTISAFADDPDDAYVPQSAGDSAPSDSILIENLSSSIAQAYIVETPVVHLPTKDLVKVEVSRGQIENKAQTTGDTATATSSPSKDKPPGTAKRKKKVKDATVVAENAEKKPPKTPSSTPRKPRRKKTENPPNSSSLTDSEAGMIGPILQMVGTFAPKMAAPLLNFQNNHNTYHPSNSPGPLFHGPQILPRPHDNTASVESNPTSSIQNYSSSGIISGRPINSLSCSSDATTLSLQNMVELHCQSESVIYEHQPTQSIVLCQSLPSDSQEPIPGGGYSIGVPTSSFGTTLIGQNSNFICCSGVTTLPIYSYSNSTNSKFAAHDLLNSTTLGGMYNCVQPLHQQFAGNPLSPGVAPSAVCCYNNSSFNAEFGGGMVYAQPAMTYMQSLPPLVNPHSVGYSTFGNVVSTNWKDSPDSNSKSKCPGSNLNPPPTSVALSSAAVYANSVHLEPFLPPPLGGLTSLASPSRRGPLNKISPVPSLVSDSQSTSAKSHPVIVSYGEKAKDIVDSPIITREYTSGAMDGRNVEHSFPRISGGNVTVSTSHFPNSTIAAGLLHDVVDSTGANSAASSEIAHRGEDKNKTTQPSMDKSDFSHSVFSVSRHRSPDLPPTGTSEIAFGERRQTSVLTCPKAGDTEVAKYNYLHNHCQIAGAKTSYNHNQIVEKIDSSKLGSGDNVVENPTDQSLDPAETTAGCSRRNYDVKNMSCNFDLAPTSSKSLAVPTAVSSQPATVSRSLNLSSSHVANASPKCPPHSPDIVTCGGVAGRVSEPFVPIPPSVVVVERKLKSSCDMNKLLEDFRDLRYYQLQKPFVHVRKTNRRNGEKSAEKSFPPKSPPYSCWICDLTFGSRREARLHFLLSPSHSTDTVCLRCLRPFPDRTERAEHDRGVHEKVARLVQVERVKWKVDPENVVVPVILEKMCIN